MTPGDIKSTENHFIQGRERLRVSKNSLFRETWSFPPRVCHGAPTASEKPGHSHSVPARELLLPQRNLVISTPYLLGNSYHPRETWSFPLRQGASAARELLLSLVAHPAARPSWWPLSLSLSSLISPGDFGLHLPHFFSSLCLVTCKPLIPLSNS